MAQKALCRLVQGGFRLALPLLPYREPKILNRVEQVAELLKEQKLDSALLVTDPGLRGAGLTKGLEEQLAGGMASPMAWPMRCSCPSCWRNTARLFTGSSMSWGWRQELPICGTATG